MSRLRWVGAAVGGVALLALAIVLAFEGASSDPETLVGVAVLAGLAALGWHLRRRRNRQSRQSSARREGQLPPEHSPEEYPLSGTNLPALLSDAERAARDEDDIAAGLTVVRPVLRQTLFAVLREGGMDRETADRALETGTWTDEPAAAAVLDNRVPLPALTLRERVVVWLFPERFVRAYIRAAVADIAALAERELPTVPGQNAPRPVPVRQPSLGRLRQGLDGSPRAVADPFGDAGGGELSDDLTDGRALHERLGVVEPEESE